MGSCMKWVITIVLTIGICRSSEQGNYEGSVNETAARNGDRIRRHAKWSWPILTRIRNWKRRKTEGFYGYENWTTTTTTTNKPPWNYVDKDNPCLFQSDRPGDLSKCLQPNDVDRSYEFATDAFNCARECVSGGSPRICYYQFHFENYVTLSRACRDCGSTGKFCDLPQCIPADGYERPILSVNRRLPGPSIQVCQGDRIVVDVINKMPGKTTTIHWHGILQKGTPYQDGVPMITQCPIHEGTTFRYDFDAKQEGTYYWHSHNGIQKLDGLQGSLIVRRPMGEDPNGYLYDEDLPAHVITIMDWYHSNTDDQFPGISHPSPDLYISYFLINGRGRYKDPHSGNTTKTPYTKFRVTSGKRYRFRVIGAICDHCYVRLSIESHRLTVIATDGNAIRPVDVDYVAISSGERYDFVLRANQEVKSYWIKVRGQGTPCLARNQRQLAILKYEGSNDEEPKTVIRPKTDFNSPGKELNPAKSTCHGEGICVAQLEAIEYFDERIMDPIPDVSFRLHVGYYFPSFEEEYHSNTYNSFVRPGANTVDVQFVINNISQKEPSSPLLTQRSNIPKEEFCPIGDDGLPHCVGDICRCVHILKVPVDAMVQIIIIDQSRGGSFNHPFHLHGFVFNVMAMGYMEDNQINEETIEQLMWSNKIPMSPAPVLKDTLTVPAEGYSVIRFIADNPGYWLFHCHFLFHHVVGMSLVLQVGDTEDYPDIPEDFPKCGNHLPPVVNRH